MAFGLMVVNHIYERLTQNATPREMLRLSNKSDNPEDKRLIQTGDYVRIKCRPEKAPFLAIVGEGSKEGLIGGAEWWPDAWWSPKQIERVFPNEDVPADWCQFEWKPELLPDYA